MKKNYIKIFFVGISVASFLIFAATASAADWNVAPGQSIQAVIDVASPGETINVAAGTYFEYLHITTDNLTIIGAGIGQSIIDLDGLMPYWHYPVCGGGNYASRAGVMISGYGSGDEIVEGVTFRGFTVMNAGLNPPTPYAEFIDNGDGQDIIRGIVVANGRNILIQNCEVLNSGYNGIGVGSARCTSLKQSEGVTIDSCISSDNWETGITVGNYVGPITITNNTCSNNMRPHPDPSEDREFSGKGIEVSGKKGASPSISGLISGNTCSNNGYQGIVLKKYSDGVTVENNIVTGSNFDEDGAGIFFYGDKSKPDNCKNNTIRNNTVTGNIRGIVAYYAQYCTIEGNKIKTDSGVFAPGQEAIKIDGGNNILVKDNNISCDGVGIGVQNTWNDVESFYNTFTGNTIKRAKFAGIRIKSGAHDNEFIYNTIKDTKMLTRWAGETYEETQGDGVIIDDSAGDYNVFHNNNIYNNHGDGMENQSVYSVAATCNWWGHYLGPSGDGSGLGDAVIGDIVFDPWLKLPEGLVCEIKQAKIEFKKKANDDKARVKGQLGRAAVNCKPRVPSVDNVVRLILAARDIARMDFLIYLEEKGKNGEIWEYKRPKDGTGPVKRMKIDWNNGKFDVQIDKADLSELSDYAGGLFSIAIKIQSDMFSMNSIILTEKKDGKWEYKQAK